MWEKTRVDGTRRLKCDAVPTLFSFMKPKQKRKPPTKRLVKANLEDTVGELAIPSTSGQQQLPTKEDSGESSTEPESIDGDYKQDLMALEEKVKKYHQEYTKALYKVRKYKKELRNKKHLLKQTETIEKENTKLLYSIFSNDQVNALKRKSTKFMKWSNTTVKKALNLKFSCGANGYRELQKQKIPLPSLRTLRRRLQHLQFDSGILHEVFEFLKIKVGSFKDDNEKECVLIMDEMAITPSSTFDASLNKYFGKITLPEHEGDATHVLVFMLGGISTRWKQTVAYYFTGDSVRGNVYEQIIVEIIKKTEALGLKVVSLTSDMRSSNQGLWKVWNIGAGRHSEIHNFTAHPQDKARNMYIFADAPHVFKNIKNMMVCNKILTISESIQEKYELPTNTVYEYMWNTCGPHFRFNQLPVTTEF
jgi:hypothetical protein